MIDYFLINIFRKLKPDNIITNIGGNGFAVFFNGKKEEIKMSKFENYIRSLVQAHPELKIKLNNGSIIQLVGTDKYDSVRGTNPKGCVFSEYAFQNPLAWEVVRPILAANGGWAIFNTTPNGKNHSYKLYEFSKNNPKWFTQVLTVDDTKAVEQDILNEERLSMSREMFLQEYYCSFDVGAIGSIYGEQIEMARPRFTSLPIVPEKAIYVISDLGFADSTALWFFQKNGEFFNAIHYYENNRKQTDFYFRYINDYIDKHNSQLGKLVLPHDSKNGSVLTNQTVHSQAEGFFGNHKVYYLKRGSISQRIDATRKMFPRVKINKDECSLGIDCLENYKFKYDEKKKVFSKQPNHDWSSHGSDAFGYAMEYFESLKPPQIKVADYDNNDYGNTNPFSRF